MKSPYDISPRILKLITKIPLIISVIIVIPAAVIYGFCPDLFFDISLKTNDEQSAFKAVLGLYFGFSIVWILGILKPSFLKPAIISNTIFMLGLGFGRCLSMVVDGLPGTFFLYGTVGELILGFYGLWVLTAIYSE